MEAQGKLKAELLTEGDEEEKREALMISRSAFRECSSLTAITIPDGVTMIGEGAFSGCSSLAAINKSLGIPSFGYMAFCSL